MLIFVIAVVVIALPILIGALIASGSVRLDNVVQETKTAVEAQGKTTNLNVTMGYDISYKEDEQVQIKEARILAAKRAAALPRGGNVGIGRLGDANLRSASQGFEDDPWSAAKVAQFHGWDGAKSGIPADGVPVVAAAPGVGLAGIEVPKFVEITDGMDPAEKRKARIGNSKAKSAFNKALKAAGIDPKTVKIVNGKVVMPQGTAVSQATAAPVVAATPSVDLSGIEPPQFVELTDDMDPAAKRKARIGNSKAKSAFNKALKAAGIDPKTVKIENGKVIVPGGATAAAPAPAAPVPQAAAPAAPAATGGSVDLAALGIERPNLTELTDDMDPAAKRQARIANSKAKSAFNKALKAAGIDPKSI